ncbi:hypothetical protein [Planctobacterium marinum]|uniref:Uncharacterized protein n=1 Tax=Planctobacterium marinum TaxID=1631968 RepID=A0AA48HPB8_9ALTE|nr:hypothetical protein MACH26_27130 [Planctobacterium marinum]
MKIITKRQAKKYYLAIAKQTKKVGQFGSPLWKLFVKLIGECAFKIAQPGLFALMLTAILKALLQPLLGPLFSAKTLFKTSGQ